MLIIITTQLMSLKGKIIARRNEFAEFERILSISMTQYWRNILSLGNQGFELMYSCIICTVIAIWVRKMITPTKYMDLDLSVVESILLN